MKKIMIILLSLLIVFSFAACSSTSYDSEEDPEELEEEYEEESEEEEEDENQDDYSIDWNKVQYHITDTDGYTYSVNIKLSPWILLSKNQGLIDYVWKTVLYDDVWNKDNDQDLPDYDGWGIDSNGFRKMNNPNNGFSKSNMNDMYYCIGSVDVSNDTEGWDASEDNPRSPSIILSSNIGDNISLTSISRVFYSDEYEDAGDKIEVNPKMKDNYWGPVPFVVMTPEAFTPNNPDGECIEDVLRNYFRVESSDEELSDIQVGVIDKEGEYHDPIAPEKE